MRKAPTKLNRRAYKGRLHGEPRPMAGLPIEIRPRKQATQLMPSSPADHAAITLYGDIHQTTIYVHDGCEIPEVHQPSPSGESGWRSAFRSSVTDWVVKHAWECLSTALLSYLTIKAVHC